MSQDNPLLSSDGRSNQKKLVKPQVQTAPVGEASFATEHDGPAFPSDQDEPHEAFFGLAREQLQQDEELVLEEDKEDHGENESESGNSDEIDCDTSSGSDIHSDGEVDWQRTGRAPDRRREIQTSNDFGGPSARKSAMPVFNVLKRVPSGDRGSVSPANLPISEEVAGPSDYAPRGLLGQYASHQKRA